MMNHRRGHDAPPGAFPEYSELWRHLHEAHARFGARGPMGPPRGGGGRGASWGDWFGSPPPRADRGGVRYLVLDALAERPRHGYEVIQVIEERSGGSYRPSPGVIYPTLQLLEELGLSRLVEQENRKIYEITAGGLADLHEHRQEVSDFYERFAEDSWASYVENFGDIMKRLGRLFRTLKRASSRGRLTPKTLKRVSEVIDTAVRDVEAAFEEEG